VGESTEDAETPASAGSTADQTAVPGAAPDGVSAAESPENRKRRRRRRRRKKPRREGAEASPQAGAHEQGPTTDQVTPEIDAAQADSPGIAATPAPDAPGTQESTGAPQVTASEPAAASEGSPEPERKQSSEPSKKDLARGERCLEFCRRHLEALGLDATSLPQQAPSTLEELAALDTSMSVERLRQAAGTLEKEAGLILLGEALVAAPTLQRLTLFMEISPDGAPIARDHKLLELVRRLDAADDSDVLSTWIAQVQRHVPQRQQIEWLLAATENKNLRRALEARAESLPEAWGPLLEQARVLAAVLIRAQTNQWGARTLHQAIRTLLRSKADSLEHRAPAVRLRFLKLATDLRLDKLEAATLERHANSLNGAEDAAQLALELAATLLAQGRYGEAQARLQSIESSTARPVASKWLKALAAPRFGDVALMKSRIKPPIETRHNLRPGFALREQTDVWLRVGAGADAREFQQHAEVHRRAEVPCVTPLRYFGITRERRPFAAFERQGDNAKHALQPARGLTYHQSVGFAEQLLRLAYGLARAGVVLPDADLGRLELSNSGQLWLVESWGIHSAAIDVAQEKMLAIAREWLLGMLGQSQHFELSAEHQENLQHSADFATLRAALDQLGRVYVWEG
jgi:hypothetical protein